MSRPGRTNRGNRRIYLGTWDGEDHWAPRKPHNRRWNQRFPVWTRDWDGQPIRLDRLPRPILPDMAEGVIPAAAWKTNAVSDYRWRMRELRRVNRGESRRKIGVLMATLMRCTSPHWQGNTFVDAGTVLPAGHPQVIPEWFEVYEIEEPPDPEAELEALRVAAEHAGVKIDKRWGADRLREEIAAAGG